MGIVRDVHQVSPGQPARAEVYWPIAQAGERPWHFSLRVAGDPARVIGDIPGLVRSVNDRFFADQIATAEQIMWQSIAEARFRTLLTSLYSCVAIVLAVIGAYGVMAYAVARRRKEFGLRMALGAAPRAMFMLSIRQGFMPCLLGLIIGTVVSLAVVRWIGNLLFDVSPNDPWTLAAAASLVAAANVFACYLPAHRAAQVDPLAVLRYE